MVALITPAVDLRTFGVTVIGTLLPGAMVPFFGDIESNVVAFVSPVIAQLSGSITWIGQGESLLCRICSLNSIECKRICCDNHGW